jgi:hypothetical protein
VEAIIEKVAPILRKTYSEKSVPAVA